MRELVMFRHMQIYHFAMPVFLDSHGYIYEKIRRLNAMLGI